MTPSDVKRLALEGKFIANVGCGILLQIIYFRSHCLVKVAFFQLIKKRKIRQAYGNSH